jgi:Family of unknown function (DUF6088)
MCTSTFIRKHILNLPKGMIFSTREMLNYGKRSAVDQCLYRLVKSGRIIRLAWGLFMKDDSDIVKPSTFTVAKEKARAFGKTILSRTLNPARFYGKADFNNENISYPIQGHSSSFKYGETTINFQGICMRKISLGDASVGLAISELWRLGNKHCNQHILATATVEFNRSERLQFHQSCHLMPSWMTNLFKR